MIIKITTGCTAFNTTFDGVGLNDINVEQTLDYLLPKLRERVLSGYLPINYIVELFEAEDSTSSFEPCEPCEQCGDTVETTTYNI